MYFNYIKYIPIVFQLQTTNKLLLSRPQNTKYKKLQIYFKYTYFNYLYFNFKTKTNYFYQSHKIQNTKYFKCISNPIISITCTCISITLTLTNINVASL